jgi:hypothetical protein
VSSSREQRDAVAGRRRYERVLVANYGSERPPLSDKRSYGCTTGKRGLCLVYNAAMKRELRARLDTDPGAPAPPACTLHSAAHTCFSGVCGRRTREHRTGSDREPQRRDAAPTEVTHIMVDEAQDMKPLFYLICRLVSMARSPPTLMLVGDPPNRRSIAGTLRTRASDPRPSLSRTGGGPRLASARSHGVFRCPPRWSRPTTPCPGCR